MKKLLEGIITAVIFMILVASVVGFILDRPILVSYAYSESMTPTINKGDLFFMNPLSRNADVGDIIVFHRSDGWTVHRVYAIVDGKYVTKGDLNVATDQQDGAYPEVKPTDVAGKVVQISNHPLVIRGGGDFIVSLRKRLTNVYAIVIIVILGGLLTFSGSSTGRSRRKSKRSRFIRIQGKTLYGIVSVLMISGFLAVVIASWGTLAFTYSSTLAGGQREGWYLPGTTFEKNLSVENHAVYPFYYFFKDDSGRVELKTTGFRLAGGEAQNLSLTVTVPEDTRIYREEVSVRSYPALLPYSLINWGYSISPYFPLVLYLIPLSALLFAFYWISGISGEVVSIRKGKILSKLTGDGRL
ncbi:signal peptidase I [Thermococcus peptonophilus]|uniref:S26 family signal peptidase n=1 Tax=Thermococcus peptonophilus TaxID=53952 RepID=A0A142CXN4_9EURY|nr:signal peptidase I [Thermococcus peptonophilus]AMQ19536.1 S26 family signal peptidase [Thermococcus peptonophilus]